MQDNWYIYYSGNAPVNSAPFIDMTSTFTYTGKSTDVQEWSAVATPTIENNGGSMAAPSDLAENVDYAAQALYHPASLSCMLPVTPTDHRHPSDAHSTPWPSGAEAASARAYAPQIAWRDESNLGPTQRDRSQVPSGPTNLDTFGQSWSQRGDDRHAVQALAVPEPVFPRNAHHPQYPVPALSYTPALPQGVISTGHASLGNFGPWVADPVLRQAPSPSKRRRYHDNPGPRPHVSQQPVTCEKCKKSMRRQSLRRHIREVHDHIKRPHPKSRFEAQSGP